jgi:hypothetical protein
MSPLTITEDLKALAKDLSKDFPRSPRETLGGFVLGARMVDKCRAVLNGTAGEYHFNCPLDRILFDFTGIDAQALQAFVATGANDAAVGAWIKEHSKVKDKAEIVRWNNELRDKNLSDLSPEIQVYMEDYIADCLPKGRVIYRWFDVYDIEEQRL